MDYESLLENHLMFVRRHRGEVVPTASGYAIRSARPEFTYGVALRRGPIDRSLHTVYRPDFGEASVQELESDGFRPAGALRYMTRSTTSAEGDSDVRVTVASPQDADLFADVQTRGFFDREQDHADWFPFMRDAARRNVVDEDQTFLIGWIDDVAAGVTLTVQTYLAGVYAVATPAAFRKRGVATALLHAALRRAANRGCTTATLQVAVGSNAERLYSRLGFVPRFTSEIWRRELPGLR